MTYGYTTLFRRSYANLAEQEQERIDTAIKKFCKRPRYPFPKGLRVHKLDGVYGTRMKQDTKTPPVWEMHATEELLITFQRSMDAILFRNCGHHKAVLQSP